MNNKLIFIVNPISGKGKGKTIIPVIESFLKEKSLNFEILIADYAGHAIELSLSKIKENPTAIIACGGDGTINEIAQTLVNTNIPLGIIPIGSGNGLASNLNIPTNINKALENIVSHNLLQMDVGKINDRYFFSNTGMGVDAIVINRYAKKKQRNFIGYLKASVWTIRHFKSKKIKVTIDNELTLKNKFYFAFCSNSNIAGYNVSFTPFADLADGKLDVLFVERLNIFEQFYFFCCVIFKKLETFKKATIRQVEQISFETKKSKNKLQIDGEAVKFKTNKINISVLPKALTVIIPKN